MIKRDSYYFKEGKLELSMLDEEIDDQKENSVYIQLRDINTSNEEQQSSTEQKSSVEQKVSDESIASGEVDSPEIKISPDVINTLKAMGEFLTKQEASEEEVSLATSFEEVKKTSEEEGIKEAEALTNFDNYFHNEASMKQGSIDAFLLSHFGEVQPKFKYAEELKQIIENQIKKIKS